MTRFIADVHTHHATPSYPAVEPHNASTALVRRWTRSRGGSPTWRTSCRSRVAAGIDLRVLSAPPAMLAPPGGGGLARDDQCRVNDALALTVAAHPGEAQRAGHRRRVRRGRCSRGGRAVRAGARTARDRGRLRRGRPADQRPVGPAGTRRRRRAGRAGLRPPGQHRLPHPRVRLARPARDLPGARLRERRRAALAPP